VHVFRHGEYRYVTDMNSKCTVLTSFLSKHHPELLPCPGSANRHVKPARLSKSALVERRLFRCITPPDACAQVSNLATIAAISRVKSTIRPIMKIHQLPPGARFEYEGEEYVKTGPLLGTGKGGQRLIPKYAVLKVQGTSESMRDKHSPPCPGRRCLRPSRNFMQAANRT
jgi:hypothetical protein